MVTGLASSTPVPTTKTLYDPATGLPTATVSLNGSTETGRISTGYDKWGRTVSYTDTDGAATTTSYDTAGRVAQVVDPKGTTGYGYDGTDANGNEEHRGLTTSLTVSGVGTFTAGYDPDGAMTTQTIPGGITQTTSYDTAGEPVGLSYQGQITTVDPDTQQPTVGTGPWLSWSQDNDILGRVRRESTPAGSAFTDGPGVDELGQVRPYDTGDAIGFDRSYGYDQAGRLVTVNDRTAPQTGAELAGCVTRVYGFDANGNRAALTTRPANTDGTCASTAGTTKTWTSDTADRPAAGMGYVYDLLGRTLTLPAADSPNGHDVTALTAAGFIPGIGAAVWAYRAYRIVRFAQAATGMSRGIRATRATSWLAGRMWTGVGSRATSVGRISKDGLRQWRAARLKGDGYVKSNFERRLRPKGKMGSQLPRLPQALNTRKAEVV